MGVDVHPYVAVPPADDVARPLMLAGLAWPGERALAGDSDADVAAHACCDALFSAAGIGDLGAHFGTGRPEYAEASGLTLLAEAAARVRAAGFADRQRRGPGHRQLPEGSARAGSRPSRPCPRPAVHRSRSARPPPTAWA